MTAGVAMALTAILAVDALQNPQSTMAWVRLVSGAVGGLSLAALAVAKASAWQQAVRPLSSAELVMHCVGNRIVARSVGFDQLYASTLGIEPPDTVEGVLASLSPSSRRSVDAAVAAIYSGRSMACCNFEVAGDPERAGFKGSGWLSWEGCQGATLDFQLRVRPTTGAGARTLDNDAQWPESGSTRHS